MDAAAGEERARLRQLQRFHDDALAREGRIAVDQDRQHARAGGVAAAFLACAHRTFDHRIHDLEMRGIERQRHVHIAAGRAQIRREALVVLHVARALHVRGVVLAFEFVEQHRGRLAEQVHQHVEAATMRHADDALFDALLAATLDEVVQQRDQRVAAFERETLLADVLGVQVALEAFGRRELPEDVLLLVDVELAACSRPTRYWSCSHRRSSVFDTCANSAPMVPQ